MKKIMFICLMLICAVSLNAQVKYDKMNSDYFQTKAKKDFIAGGAFVGFGAIIATIPLTLDWADETKYETNKTNTIICEVVAGVCVTTSVICFISGGVNLHKSFSIKDKKYTLETNGMSLKFKF